MEMVAQILLLQLEFEMDKVPEAFVIPPLEVKDRVYATCFRSSMNYGSETRPLLADVRLKFERAEMQMTRWMKDRGTSEQLRKLVGVEPITTVIRKTQYLTISHRPSDSPRPRQRLLLSGDVHQNTGPATKYPCCCMPSET